MHPKALYGLKRDLRYKDVKRMMLALAIHSIPSTDPRLVPVKASLANVFATIKIPDLLVWIFSRLSSICLVTFSDSAMTLELEPRQVNSFLGWYSANKLVNILVKLTSHVQDTLTLVHLHPNFQGETVRTDLPLSFCRYVSESEQKRFYTANDSESFDLHETANHTSPGGKVNTTSNFGFGEIPTSILGIEDDLRVSYNDIMYNHSIGFCLAMFLDFRVGISDYMLQRQLTESTHVVEITNMTVLLVDLLRYFTSKHSKPSNDKQQFAKNGKKPHNKGLKIEKRKNNSNNSRRHDIELDPKDHKPTLSAGNNGNTTNSGLVGE